METVTKDSLLTGFYMIVNKGMLPTHHSHVYITIVRFLVVSIHFLASYQIYIITLQYFQGPCYENSVFDETVYSVLGLYPVIGVYSWSTAFCFLGVKLVNSILLSRYITGQQNPVIWV